MRAGPMCGTREIASQYAVSLSASGDPTVCGRPVIVTLAFSLESSIRRLIVEPDDCGFGPPRSGLGVTWIEWA